MDYVNEEYLENELLSKFDLECFDLERTRYRVLKFISKYRLLKLKCFNMVQIKITSNYKYIYVDESHNDCYTELDRYVDEKMEYQRISQQLTQLTEMLTDEERVYFTISLLNGKSEKESYNKIGCSNFGLIPIKNSCLVKFACAFNVEVYKGDVIPIEKDEEEFNIMVKGVI